MQQIISAPDEYVGFVLGVHARARQIFFAPVNNFMLDK